MEEQRNDSQPHVSRRRLIAGAAGIAAGISVASQLEPAAAALPFKPWHAIGANPNLTSYGVEKLSMSFESVLWPAGASHDQPHQATVEARATALQNAGIYRTCVDIEEATWELKDTTDAVFAERAQKYINVLDWMHGQSPTLRLGLYLHLPRREYWAVKNNNATQLQAWYADNTRRQVIASHVNDLYPSLYAFYSDQAGWVSYANANLTEAGKYNKPVYAFIWPKYHPSNNEGLGGTFVPTSYWRLQLETLKAHPKCNGMVIYMESAQAWNPSAPWWIETQDFLSTL